jgi:hypothetical protein
MRVYLDWCYWSRFGSFDRPHDPNIIPILIIIILDNLPFWEFRDPDDDINGIDITRIIRICATVLFGTVLIPFLRGEVGEMVVVS